MQLSIIPQIDSSWKDILQDEFHKAYFSELNSFLLSEKEQHTIYPEGNDIFNAFNSTPFDHVKVVILGQDPYHGVDQAHGLAFSVQDNVPLPPSLQNIFKEYCEDLRFPMPHSGNLMKWAREGVFLLNTVLTVRAHQAHSHIDQGWERFTDHVIYAIGHQKEHVVFILWGRPAQMKEKLIDTSKHLIIKSPHPSPLSAYRGFFGSKPFSRSNDYLIANGIEPIDWHL